MTAFFSQSIKDRHPEGGAGLSVSKKVLRAPAPSDEGAVSVADWGREDLKSYEFFINIEKT